MPTKEDIFFQAYQNQDRQYEGLFFLAVKTTGIFCRPGCTAKLPKRENVEFFPTVELAMQQGYRPCKKCHPLKRAGDQPDWVSRVMQLMQNNLQQRISDTELIKHQIDPARCRRWFQQQYGLTFQAYQRQFKVNHAYDQIKQGHSVIDSALDSGFNSLSGFNESFRKLTGFVPSQSKTQKIIPVSRVLTPLGPMIAAGDDKGLCLLEFHDRKQIKQQIEKVQNRLKAKFVPGDHELFIILQQQLNEYFDKKRQGFDIPLQLKGTEFQLKAWQALQQIPYAETRYYEQEANKLGKPEAIRAVATANACNPVAILVPCHRVINKSGGLSGYAGGVGRKQFLIKLEQQGSNK